MEIEVPIDDGPGEEWPSEEPLVCGGVPTDIERNGGPFVIYITETSEPVDVVNGTINGEPITRAMLEPKIIGFQQPLRFPPGMLCSLKDPTGGWNQGGFQLKPPEPEVDTGSIQVTLTIDSNTATVTCASLYAAQSPWDSEAQYVMTNDGNGVVSTTISVPPRPSTTISILSPQQAWRLTGGAIFGGGGDDIPIGDGEF